jgi:hypothetical protein
MLPALSLGVIRPLTRTAPFLTVGLLPHFRSHTLAINSRLGYCQRTERLRAARRCDPRAIERNRSVHRLRGRQNRAVAVAMLGTFIEVVGAKSSA